ncbi:MAG: acetyl-CoA carboxylase biotin carboxyl carrier protein [Clostridia bacterium]
MKINEIKELAQIMQDCSLTSLEIDGEKITMKREATAVISAPVIKATVAETDETQKAVKTSEGKVITAPTVGVFYASSSPDASAYVKVGDKVELGDVMCIIEAMKLMNEIQADCSGEIVEILAKNGDVVEYGQELFRLK